MKKRPLSPIKFFLEKKKDFTPGIFEDFLDSVFSINKTEKKKILTLLKKSNIHSLLFMTDANNLENLFVNGIVPLKDLELKENEIYSVWSFFQQEESLALELESSSHAHFWKWISDLDFNPEEIAVIGINPHRLSQLTKKDWLLDRAQNLISVSEKIYVETFDWVLIQNLQVYKKIKTFLHDLGLKIDLYYGNEGVVKIQRPRAVKKTLGRTNPHLREENENE